MRSPKVVLDAGVIERLPVETRCSLRSDWWRASRRCTKSFVNYTSRYTISTQYLVYGGSSVCSAGTVDLSTSQPFFIPCSPNPLSQIIFTYIHRTLAGFSQSESQNYTSLHSYILSPLFPFQYQNGENQGGTSRRGSFVSHSLLTPHVAPHGAYMSHPRDAVSPIHFTNYLELAHVSPPCGSR